MTKSVLKLPKSGPVFIVGDLIKPKANLDEVFLVSQTEFVSPGVWNYRLVCVWKSENRENMKIGDSFPWDEGFTSYYEKVKPGSKIVLIAG